jgi:signal transduction histidine kinase
VQFKTADSSALAISSARLEVSRLHEFIAANQAEIIRRCRAKVASRSMPPPTHREIDHGVPVFLDQLVNAMRLGLISSPEIGWTGLQHGHDLLLQGFTASQVVHDCGDDCQAITELALQTDAPISTDDFRALNRCLDEAIAGAVTEYGRGRNQPTLESQTARGSERLWYFAHELRNLINTSIVAFEVLKTGNVGLAGSTGAVLQRSFTGLRALVGRSLAEVRLTQAVQNLGPLSVSEFIDELAPATTLEANARGIRFIVMPIEAGVAVEADQRVLAAVVGNLLQNAFKFTQPRSTVTLRVAASAERVLIEVLDECLGLPGGTPMSCSAPSSSAAPTEPAWAWSRVQSMGRGSEQRPDLGAQPGLHRGSAAQPGFRGGVGVGIIGTRTNGDAVSGETFRRRTFLGTMAAFPAGVLAQQQAASPSGVGVKVAAGEGRFGRALKLPDGSPLFIKVASHDTGGAFFLTEQPSGQRGGPPSTFTSRKMSGSTASPATTSSKSATNAMS